MSAFPHVLLNPSPIPGYETTFEANIEKLKDLERRVKKIRTRALCIDNMRSAIHRDVCMSRFSLLFNETPYITSQMGGEARITELCTVVFMALENAERITTAVMHDTEALLNTISRTVNHLESIQSPTAFWYILPATTVASVQALLDKTNEPLKMMRKALDNAEAVEVVRDRMRELEAWFFRCYEEENALLL